MTVRQQQYLLRILWREALRVGRGDPGRAAAYLPRIMAATGIRFVVLGPSHDH